MEQDKAREKKIKEKAEFYFKENLKAHLSIIPNGFKNGYFVSKLIEEKFYWFICDIDGKIRLFLSEIYDIQDYKEETKL